MVNEGIVMHVIIAAVLIFIAVISTAGWIIELGRVRAMNLNLRSHGLMFIPVGKSGESLGYLETGALVMRHETTRMREARFGPDQVVFTPRAQKTA
jgi:hypothetical protein